MDNEQWSHCPLPTYPPVLSLVFGNKKFLETDYPQGRALVAFRRTVSYRYHFGLRAKSRNFVFCLARKPRGRAVGEL